MALFPNVPRARNYWAAVLYHGGPTSGTQPALIARCYTRRGMFARKLKVEVLVDGQRRPAPLDWLDSFCMRNFTGSAEFDDTLPTGEGMLEAGLKVDPERLAAAIGEWLTKRGKGNGKPVTVEIRAAN
jgi:hypothetical protein